MPAWSNSLAKSSGSKPPPLFPSTREDFFLFFSFNLLTGSWIYQPENKLLSNFSLQSASSGNHFFPLTGFMASIPPPPSNTIKTVDGEGKNWFEPTGVESQIYPFWFFSCFGQVVENCFLLIAKTQNYTVGKKKKSCVSSCLLEGPQSC